MIKLAGKGWLTARLPEPYYLPFPSFGLNRALGGYGLASGRISVYWGQKASGKSSLALMQIAHAQQQGKVCAYIDAERALDQHWAEKCGVDVDALLYKRENSAEDILIDLLPDLDAGKIDVVVADSLSSINFDMYFDTQDPTKNAMGSYARSSKMFTHKVLSHLGYDQHVILISHAAMDLSGQRPMLRAAVGNAIEHWASTIIKVTKSNDRKRIEDGGEFCIPVDWTVNKSKQSVYPVSGKFNFNPNTAEIDGTGEILSYAVEEGLIETGGAWHYYPNKEDALIKGQGRAKTIDMLNHSPELLQEITEKLSANTVVAEEDDE